jgi:hypothetical protein
MKKKLTIKYVVIPGKIISRYDGDLHYINALKLMALYKVNPAECVIKYGDHRDSGRDFTGLIRLFPRSDGNYETPK